MLTIEVPTVPATDLDVSSYVSFCGAYLYKPSLAVRISYHLVHSQVYVAGVQDGSPTDLYDLRPTAFICAVQHRKVVTMDDFERAVSQIPDNQYFDLRLVISNCQSVITLKKYTREYPTYKCNRESPYSNGLWLTSTIDGTVGESEI